MNRWGYDTDAVRLRHLANNVCNDVDCDLSFGQAHAGPCIPCKCGKDHAEWECPDGELPRRLHDAEQSFDRSMGRPSFRPQRS